MRINLPIFIHQFADILVPVVRIIRRCGGGVVKHERTGGDGFCWIPDEAVGFGAGVGQCAVAGDTEVIVVCKGVVGVGCGCDGFEILHAASHATFVIVVPSSGRAVGLNLRNLMAAVPRRGRDLTGEILQRRALAFCVVCHAVSSNSIPNSVDECICFLFENPLKSIIYSCCPL